MDRQFCSIKTVKELIPPEHPAASAFPQERWCHSPFPATIPLCSRASPSEAFMQTTCTQMDTPASWTHLQQKLKILHISELAVPKMCGFFASPYWI